MKTSNQVFSAVLVLLIVLGFQNCGELKPLQNDSETKDIRILNIKTPQIDREISLGFAIPTFEYTNPYDYTDLTLVQDLPHADFWDVTLNPANLVDSSSRTTWAKVAAQTDTWDVGAAMIGQGSSLDYLPASSVENKRRALIMKKLIEVMYRFKSLAPNKRIAVGMLGTIYSKQYTEFHEPNGTDPSQFCDPIRQASLTAWGKDGKGTAWTRPLLEFSKGVDTFVKQAQNTTPSPDYPILNSDINFRNFVKTHPQLVDIVFFDNPFFRADMEGSCRNEFGKSTLDLRARVLGLRKFYEILSTNKEFFLGAIPRVSEAGLYYDIFNSKDGEFYAGRGDISPTMKRASIKQLANLLVEYNFMSFHIESAGAPGDGINHPNSPYTKRDLSGDSYGLRNYGRIIAIEDYMQSLKMETGLYFGGIPRSLIGDQAHDYVRRSTEMIREYLSFGGKSQVFNFSSWLDVPDQIGPEFQSGTQGNMFLNMIRAVTDTEPNLLISSAYFAGSYDKYAFIRVDGNFASSGNLISVFCDGVPYVPFTDWENSNQIQVGFLGSSVARQCSISVTALGRTVASTSNVFVPQNQFTPIISNAAFSGHYDIPNPNDPKTYIHNYSFISIDGSDFQTSGNKVYATCDSHWDNSQKAILLPRLVSQTPAKLVFLFDSSKVDHTCSVQVVSKGVSKVFNNIAVPKNPLATLLW